MLQLAILRRCQKKHTWIHWFRSTYLVPHRICRAKLTSSKRTKPCHSCPTQLTVSILTKLVALPALFQDQFCRQCRKIWCASRCCWSSRLGQLPGWNDAATRANNRDMSMRPSCSMALAQAWDTTLKGCRALFVSSFAALVLACKERGPGWTRRLQTTIFLWWPECWMTIYRDWTWHASPIVTLTRMLPVDGMHFENVTYCIML